jgi:hypothetical protein
MPVQRHEAVATEQLGLSHPDQQLTSGGTTTPLLERADPSIEAVDHVERVHELRQRSDPE